MFGLPDLAHLSHKQIPKQIAARAEHFPLACSFRSERMFENLVTGKPKKSIWTDHRRPRKCRPEQLLDRWGKVKRVLATPRLSRRRGHGGSGAAGAAAGAAAEAGPPSTPAEACERAGHHLESG